MLPLWIQWPQAILILVISCLGAWIAFQQVKIAKAKLNLDLYDRRFKVFEAARTCLVFVLQKADVTQEVMNALYLGTADAVFLFDKEIEEYLEKFQRQMIDFQMLNYSIKNLSPDRRGPLRISCLCKWTL